MTNVNDIILVGGVIVCCEKFGVCFRVFFGEIFGEKFLLGEKVGVCFREKFLEERLLKTLVLGFEPNLGNFLDETFFLIFGEIFEETFVLIFGEFFEEPFFFFFICNDHIFFD